MKLLLKFNLVFLLVFAAGFALSAVVARNLLQENAKDEVLDRGRLIMESAVAVAGYTSTQIAPLLVAQMEDHFLPQSVPSYSSFEVVNAIGKLRPEYAYKPATLNPTNPRDHARDWEADVIQRFRQDDAPDEAVGERGTPTGRSLYVARPIRITDAACLRCHSTPAAAPRSLVEQYGGVNGFGWQFNEVVGARIVSVPMSVPLARADHAFQVVLALLAAMFVAIGLTLNLMLYWMVIRPVSRLSAVADRVSMGELDVADFEFRARDEIGVLAASVARMRRSLVHAMKLLER
ncbi:Tll0287-like domain-containing protein [Derxia lacustris]|uniref:Tll0287-like domain-containing protein n=1 Tax=Derxia lacustris TaxID=764842 RepID=UPI000A16F163|nr:DUF3365 domain-containing protein [Derxia lacustris]